MHFMYARIWMRDCVFIYIYIYIYILLYIQLFISSVSAGRALKTNVYISMSCHQSGLWTLDSRARRGRRVRRTDGLVNARRQRCRRMPNEWMSTLHHWPLTSVWRHPLTAARGSCKCRHRNLRSRPTALSIGTSRITARRASCSRNIKLRRSVRPSPPSTGHRREFRRVGGPDARPIWVDWRSANLLSSGWANASRWRH